MRLARRIQKLERAENGGRDTTGPVAFIRVLDIIAARRRGREPSEEEREFLSRVSWPALEEVSRRRRYGGGGKADDK